MRGQEQTYLNFILFVFILRFLTLDNQIVA